MTQTNTNEAVPFATLEVTELHDAELNAIEGGVWWCGTGLPHNGIPQYPLPVPRDIFGKPITNI